jgi:hypothetical protein
MKVDDSELSDAERTEIKQIASAAIEAPEKTAFEKLASFADRVNTKLKSAVASGEAWGKLLSAVLVFGGTL